MTTALLIVACDHCEEFMWHRNTCPNWSAWMHWEKDTQKRLRKSEEIFNKYREEHPEAFTKLGL